MAPKESGSVSGGHPSLSDETFVALAWIEGLAKDGDPVSSSIPSEKKACQEWTKV